MSGDPKIVLTITATIDGKIEVTGPLDNKLLCYGLLEVARQPVQEFGIEERRILPAGVALVGR